MRIAYTVPGAPPSTAFTPIPCVNASTLNYKGGVVGQPGTLGVPSPRPDVPGNNDISGYPFAGGYSTSGAMPPVFYPNLYYQATLEIPGAEAAPVQIHSDNQMPVPANDPRGRAAVLAKPPKFLGTRQVTARKVIPRWADWLASPSFG